MKLSWPVDIKKYPITQYFGENLASYYANLGMVGHSGLDFATPNGVEVHAAHDGEVLDAYGSDTGGIGVKLINYELGIMTLYFHLSGYKVKKGDKVKAGDVIAHSDNTGKYSTGPHLHFSLYRVNKIGGGILEYNNGYHGAIDPLPYLVEELEEGQLIKNELENKVYLIKNGLRWWIGGVVTAEGEKVFADWFGYPVNKATIKVVDIPTFNSIKFGGTISNK